MFSSNSCLPQSTIVCSLPFELLDNVHSDMCAQPRFRSACAFDSSTTYWATEPARGPLLQKRTSQRNTYNYNTVTKNKGPRGDLKPEHKKKTNRITTTISPITDSAQYFQKNPLHIRLFLEPTDGRYSQSMRRHTTLIQEVISRVILSA